MLGCPADLEALGLPFRGLYTMRRFVICSATYVSVLAVDSLSLSRAANENGTVVCRKQGDSGYEV